MSVHPIRYLPEPVLRQKAKRVPNASHPDAALQRLIDDMIETMRDAPGVGLAANQVGVLLRVIVIEVPKDEDREAQRPDDWDLYVLVNPQIVKRSGERPLDEGCLSVPGYRAEVRRHRIVTAKGINREGKEVRIKARDNLLAQALEHEIDHTNGILYIDHLDSLDELVKLEPGESISREAATS